MILNQLFITVDFNIHVDVLEDCVSVAFRDVLDMYGLQQHVTETTHTSGHTLDLIISRENDDLVSTVYSYIGLPSDHKAIKCLINMKRPSPTGKRVRSHNLHNIDIAQNTGWPHLLTFDDSNDTSSWICRVSVETVWHCLRWNHRQPCSSEWIVTLLWGVVAERSSLPDSSSGVSSRMWVRIPAVTLVPLSKTLNHNCFSPPRG